MKSVTFQLPQGVEIPDGKNVGDTFQAMTTYKLLANGKVSLEEVDGEGLNGKLDPEDSPNESALDDTTEAGSSSGMGGLRSAMMGGS